MQKMAGVYGAVSHWFVVTFFLPLNSVLELSALTLRYPPCSILHHVACSVHCTVTRAVHAAVLTLSLSPAPFCGKCEEMLFLSLRT